MKIPLQKNDQIHKYVYFDIEEYHLFWQDGVYGRSISLKRFMIRPQQDNVRILARSEIHSLKLSTTCCLNPTHLGIFASWYSVSNTKNEPDRSKKTDCHVISPDCFFEYSRYRTVTMRTPGSRSDFSILTWQTELNFGILSDTLSIQNVKYYTIYY